MYGTEHSRQLQVKIYLAQKHGGLASSNLLLLAAPQHPAPEVYTKPPPQPKEKKPGQLDPKQLEQYFDKGFLIVPSFFTKEEMEPVKEVGMKLQL